MSLPGVKSAPCNATIEYTKSSWKVHEFSATISSTPVAFRVVKMEGSVMLWMGSPVDPTFSELFLAIKTRYCKMPETTQVFGSNPESFSGALATELAKRLNKPVYVSCNIPIDYILMKEIIVKVVEEIKIKPDSF